MIPNEKVKHKIESPVIKLLSTDSMEYIPSYTINWSSGPILMPRIWNVTLVPSKDHVQVVFLFNREHNRL